MVLTGDLLIPGVGMVSKEQLVAAANRSPQGDYHMHASQSCTVMRMNPMGRLISIRDVGFGDL